MTIIQSFRMAFKNILSSKARSALTMLGIIIGVAAVIVIVGLGNGMENYMTESFKSMGTNLLTVNVMGRGSSRTVDPDDMYLLAEENSDLFEAVSPTISVSASARVKTETLTSTITGLGEDYLSMRRLELYSGRYIRYADNLNRAKVCVIGSYVSNTYFSGGGIGDTVKLNGNSYTVIGILSEAADSTERSSDDVIHIPYTTAMKLNGSASAGSYSFAVVSEDNIPESKQVIEDALLEIFGNSNAYRITSMSELLDTMSSMIGIVVTVLAAIAAISLVVGGIGIMNIMLVSVSERTKEIGIRKAVGAKRRHVMWQFVVEAGTTSAIGGILGIIFGYLLSAGGSTIISAAMDAELTIAPTTSYVLFAFGISAAIGVVFGYLPARKAARLNPIDALRYE